MFRTIRTFWNGLDTKTQKILDIVFAAILVFVLFGSFIYFEMKSHKEEPVPIANVAPIAPQAPIETVISTASQPKEIDHTVKSGEYIIMIAEQYGVPWESIVLANEETLKANAQKYCADKSDNYKHSSRRRGHFCNFMVFDENGQPLVYANTLMPGDMLKIPSNSAPEQIQKAIIAVPGTRVAVVIDETGSMAGDDGVDDRARVSAWYLQAIRNSDKKIVRVIMFAEGSIRELDENHVDFHANGGYENTRHALEYAANKFHPDAIVLVTDEPGDDWENWNSLHLPPVIAHSLSPTSDNMMRELASFTHGQFLRSHEGSLAVTGMSQQ